MPTAEENAALYEIEDAISKAITPNDNAVFVSRITCRGQRELTFRVHDPELNNARLEQMVAQPKPIRPWEYCMEFDSTWALTQPELNLLERDPKFS